MLHAHDCFEPHSLQDRKESYDRRFQVFRHLFYSVNKLAEGVSLVNTCLYVDSNGSPYRSSSSWPSPLGMSKQPQSGSLLPALHPMGCHDSLCSMNGLQGWEPMSWKSINTIIGRAAID